MENAIILLAGTLLLALFIERLVETLKAIYDVYEVKNGRDKGWESLANRIADQLETRIANQTKASKDDEFHLKLVFQYLFSSDPNYRGSLLVSSDKIRTIFMKYLAKLVAIILGIGFALTTNVNVFVLVSQSTPENESFPEMFTASWASGSFGMVLTGIMMGLGAGPMHKFIVALERARQKRKPTGLV